MDERIAKASKVPFGISSVPVGRVTVCGLFCCFVWLTESHKNEEHAPTRKPFIGTVPSTILVFLHILAYSVNCGGRMAQSRPACLACSKPHMTDAHEHGVYSAVETFVIIFDHPSASGTAPAGEHGAWVSSCERYLPESVNCV